MLPLNPQTIRSFILLGSAIALAACRSAVLTYGDNDLPLEKKTVESVPYYLPKGKIETVGSWSKDSNTFLFTVTPIVEAEGGSPFWVKRHANPFFDDTMTLSVNSKGLLQTANATTQDQTAAIFAGLISAAGSALTFGAGLAPAGLPKALRREGPVPPDDAILPSIFQFVFDPEADDISSKQFWVEIPGAPGNLRRAVLFVVSVECIGTASAMPRLSSDSQHPLQGVIVRLNIPYAVKISQKATATRPAPPKEPATLNPELDHWEPTGEPSITGKRVVVIIPDKRHSYVLPLSRVPAVSRETDVALVDGSVQTLTMKRPSLVLGIASIPQTILSALVPIPLNIRQSAANNVQAVDNRLKAEADIKKLQGQ